MVVGEDGFDYGEDVHVLEHSAVLAVGQEAQPGFDGEAVAGPCRAVARPSFNSRSWFYSLAQPHLECLFKGEMSQFTMLLIAACAHSTGAAAVFRG